MIRKITMFLSFLLVSGFAMAQKSTDMDLIQKQGKLYYFQNQLYNGEVYSKFENGTMGLKGVMKNGTHEGLWIWWYSTGQKKRETTFKDGKKEGITIYWHLNGTKSKEIIYKNDKNIDQKLCDENGNRLPNPSFQQSY